MDTNNTINLSYGSQTFKGSSSKITTWAMRCSGDSMRDFPDKALQAMFGTGAYGKTPASSNGLDTHGVWYTRAYENRDGVVLCIQASTTVSGTPYNDGAIFLHLDHNAPLLKVDVSLRPNRDAVYDNITAFVGRGYLIKREELRKNYNIQLRTSYLSRYMDEEEVDELFTVNTISTGADRPEFIQVRSSKGKDTVAAIRAPARRRIRLRRNKRG